MFSVPKFIAAKRILLRSGILRNQKKQLIWGYVSIAFNKVDTHRLGLVGPDRLCAEWVMKNGGAVRTVEEPHNLLRDYNSLPPESTKFRLKEVDATGASIMKIGFEHFNGCEHIDKVTLDNCNHLEVDGLQGLLHLRSSLQHLQVSNCPNIVDKGLKVIGELVNLKVLQIFDLLYVKNLDAVVKYLQYKLPQCQISTNP